MKHFHYNSLAIYKSIKSRHVEATYCNSMAWRGLRRNKKGRKHMSTKGPQLAENGYKVLNVAIISMKTLAVLACGILLLLNLLALFGSPILGAVMPLTFIYPLALYMLAELLVILARIEINGREQKAS
ncbi:hypothetical protein [Gallaecimonas sp. GXIMD1310]|uniref:hypothetical protein n=1 Tax=Gallaecimonas sp. GXIMD1310 TaxID=3131926 RepID=UPI003253ADC0